MTPGEAALLDETNHGTPLSRFKSRAKSGANAVLRPLVSLLARLGVGPNFLTVMGALLGVGAGLAFFEGGFRSASLLLVLSGLCDILDGQMAREHGSESTFGAFLDSTLDRLAEAIVLMGIAGYYLVNLVQLAGDPMRVLNQVSRGLEPRTWMIVALTAVLALIGSFLVSYTRARAEGLGLDCKVGWFERPERMVLLIVAGLFGVGPVMPGALLLLTLMSFFTAGQRVLHVHRITRRREGASTSL
jgi:CDP-diacylglycerol--glycerol-3-phosphate 3-phosphatidyltransferase